VCSGPSYCLGNAAQCPLLTIVKECDCTPPRFGYNCTQVLCNTLSSCSECNSYSQCQFCCDSGTPTCVLSTAGCSTPYPQTCAACPPCYAGTCSCGVCICPTGFGGPFCNWTIDCTGLPVNPANETIKKMDVCNICGGNGKSCIGCDGIPFGKKVDSCGVCGGDGSSCFNPCPGTTCQKCAGDASCGWCSDDKKCHLGSYSGCKSGLETVCTSLSPAAIAGITIGAGIIAAIVIAVVVFVVASAIGSKKAYDYYMSKKTDMSAASTNPMYNDHGLRGDNPFYDKTNQ